jgi:ABC-2 type transport system ATP-binding protein
LSGGQKQRLSIALALVGNPRIAILDELTTGLDPQARRDTWGLIEAIRDRGVTIVLVTHFMEEAERLCDRLIVIDGGVVAAQGSPAELVARVEAEQRIRFQPSHPFADELLTALPEVHEVRHHGSRVEVVGDGNLLQVVASVLATHQIIAADLRMDQTSLDDAFVRLTGRASAAASEE